MARRELAVLGDHAQLLLTGEDLFTQLVPALIELALVLVGPLLRHVVWRVRRAGREVDEERLVGRETLLLPDPANRLVGHVLHQVVALFGRLPRLDGRGPLVERRVPLVGLAADESVEVLEAASARRPGIERSGRARFPDRHFVTLAELRGGVAIQLERPRQRRHRVGQHRAVARRASRNLGDAAHANGMVVSAGQQRLARGRTQRGGVEAIELQPARCQFFRGWRLAGPAKGAGCAEADVVDQDNQDVGSALGWSQSLDWRELRGRILRIERDQAFSAGVRHRQMGPMLLVLCTHVALLFTQFPFHLVPCTFSTSGSLHVPSNIGAVGL